MIRSDYIRHFCTRCQYETDHVKLTYIDHILLSCMACQYENVVEEEKEVKTAVKKTYTVVSIDQKDHGAFNKKRTVVVELLRKTEPDKLGETDTTTDTIMVQYPAYGSEHFSASVERHPDKATINHLEARAISKEIKKFIV